MFDQTLSSLTLTKPRIQGKNGQREYTLECFELSDLDAS
jgi:hypothetical protein